MPGLGVMCSEQFAEELRSRAPPNEFLLEAAGMAEMENGEVRPAIRISWFVGFGFQGTPESDPQPNPTESGIGNRNPRHFPLLDHVLPVLSCNA